MQQDRRSRKIVFLCPYPYNTAPGQRFRYEQYLGALSAAGFRWEILSFLSAATYRMLYSKGNTLRKALGVLSGFLRRLAHMRKALAADYVFVFREASPIGPPVFEWLLATVFRKKIIYDFDDAIWLPNTSAHNRIAAGIKWHQKVAYICRKAWKVSAGNEYLCANAILFRNGDARGVVHNPTTVDTERMHNQLKDQYAGELTIGWTGTHSTLIYLDRLVPVIQRLHREVTFRFRVICDSDPGYPLENFEYVPWREETEIPDLAALHIGLMPLTEDAWSEGKCGFKALQYMALGIPAVVSPVGVNKIIVGDGQDGLLCAEEEDWYQRLLLLARDPAERARMGRHARETVEARYSVRSNRGNFLRLFAEGREVFGGS